MDATLLRNLGVNEVLIQALQKSHGEEYEELEIMQDRHDLKILLKRNGFPDIKPHILILPDFFIRNGFSQKTEHGALLERYNCNDTFEFLSKFGPCDNNLKINDVGMRLSEGLLKLLRYLSQKIVDTKTGWVYIQDMKFDGVIPSDGYQPFSRLRGVIGAYLLNKDAKGLIESNGKKQYRLSINPEHIKL